MVQTIGRNLLDKALRDMESTEEEKLLYQFGAFLELTVRRYNDLVDEYGRERFEDWLVRAGVISRTDENGEEYTSQLSDTNVAGIIGDRPEGGFPAEPESSDDFQPEPTPQHEGTGNTLPTFAGVQ